MCGISGFASINPLLDTERLGEICSTLAHRGPDDAGCEVWDMSGNRTSKGVGVAGLAHRRLSIIDLSEAGHQPMSNEEGDIWLTFNGEFYNFQQYRRDLGQRHQFISNTDSETILHLFEEQGLEGTLQCINGMFALAIWDVRSRKMFLARDRLGKKPLYYTVMSDGTLLYASEIKALLKSGYIDPQKIDPIALVQFWTYGYATGEKTIFEQIKRLLPGHYAIWREGNLTTYEYWDCPFGIGELRTENLDKLADEFEALLSDAIQLRLISDVPVGLFLSGGIDSSLIAAITKKVVGADVDSFTIGFSHPDFNEAPYAAEIAKYLNLSNTVVTVEEDFEPYFESIARQFDEPFGDSSAIPTYFVSKAAKEHVTVALTGDGGDELFAGYNLYAKALSLWGGDEQRERFVQPASFRQKVSDLWFRYILKDKKLSVLEMIISPRNLKKVLTPDLWKHVEDENLYKNREQWYDRVTGADILSQFQYVNLKTYLPDDVLVKVDRMSMAHALECRSPFLDYRVVEFASRLPYWAKINNNGHQKYIIRHLLKRFLPDNLVDRPKKGFAVPWSKWCQGSLGDNLRKKWLNQQNTYQQKDAVSLLFPLNGSGQDTLQWNAFSSLLFWDFLENAKKPLPSFKAVE